MMAMRCFAAAVTAYLSEILAPAPNCLTCRLSGSLISSLTLSHISLLLPRKPRGNLCIIGKTMNDSSLRLDGNCPLLLLQSTPSHHTRQSTYIKYAWQVAWRRTIRTHNERTGQIFFNCSAKAEVPRCVVGRPFHYVISSTPMGTIDSCQQQLPSPMTAAVSKRYPTAQKERALPVMMMIRAPLFWI